MCSTERASGLRCPNDLSGPRVITTIASDRNQSRFVRRKHAPSSVAIMSWPTMSRVRFAVIDYVALQSNAHFEISSQFKVDKCNTKQYRTDVLHYVKEPKLYCWYISFFVRGTKCTTLLGLPPLRCLVRGPETEPAGFQRGCLRRLVVVVVVKDDCFLREMMPQGLPLRVDS